MGLDSLGVLGALREVQLGLGTSHEVDAVIIQHRILPLLGGARLLIRQDAGESTRRLMQLVACPRLPSLPASIAASRRGGYYGIMMRGSPGEKLPAGSKRRVGRSRGPGLSAASLRSCCTFSAPAQLLLLSRTKSLRHRSSRAMPIDDQPTSLGRLLALAVPGLGDRAKARAWGASR